MAGLVITTNAAEIVALLNAKPQQVRRVVTQEMTRLGHVWVREMVTKRFTGYTGSRNSGSRLQNRTGNLRDSIRSRVYGANLGIASTVLRLTAGDASAGYARVQETGKPRPIKPRKKQFLRVPLPAALQPGTGVPRADAMLVHRGGRNWQTASGQRTFVRANGRKLTVMRQDSKTAATPLYALVRSVRLRPRLGARNAMKTVLRRETPRIASRVLAALRRA